MYQNVIGQENYMRETPNKSKQNATTATTKATVLNIVGSAATSFRSDSADEGSKQPEYYKNVTTTIIQQQQPPNKFGMNIKKVSGKPLLPSSSGVKTQVAIISYGKKNHNSSRSASAKDMETDKEPRKEFKMTDSTTHSAHLIENFAQKKLEREQEIKEIQEMLNKIKSPQKSDSRHSEDSAKETKAEAITNENVAKDGLNTINNANKKNEAANKQQAQQLNSRRPLQRRSNTDTQLTLKSSEEHISNTTSRISRRDTTGRSCTTTTIMNKPRSQSVQLPVSATNSKNNKKIGYNPDEARRYMEMQKKQRKSQFLKEPANKSKIEKEEIKKRLEELKKNTRKLVNKNLQKKEKVVAKISLSQQLKLKPQPSNEKTSKVNKDLANELKNLEVVKKPALTYNSQTERAKNSNKTTENTARSVQSFPLIENHKRIGLLRKAENDKDFSFNSHKQYNFDKENQNLEMLTKHLTLSKANKINAESVTSKEKQHETKTENCHKEKEIQTDILQMGKDIKVSVLENPESNLKSSKTDDIPLDSLINKEIPKKETPKSSHDMPYWLRPSAAQIYPYNFIMAVRRKLESIAQPLEPKYVEKKKQTRETSTTCLAVDHNKEKKRKSQEIFEENPTKKLKTRPEDNKQMNNNTENKSSNNELTALKHLRPFLQAKELRDYIAKEKTTTNIVLALSDKKEDIQQRISLTNDLAKISLQPPVQAHAEEQLNNLQNKIETPFQNREKPLPQRNNLKQDSLRFNKQPSNYKSMESLNSEITSNLSSISLQNPLSNTLTEVSSLRTESRRTFIYSNKIHLANSDDEVISLASGILSPPEKQNKDFEFVKPLSPLSLEKVDKLKIKRNTVGSDSEKSDKEMDFTQLLEDFNRSLSHVIQVNEQLKCTLDKSQQILSPRSSKKSSDTEKQYSSDFEKSTSKMEHNSQSSDKEKLEELVEKTDEKLKHSKRQLFKIDQQVMPLLTGQKDTQNMKSALPTDNDDNPLPALNLNLDMKSLSNSSQTTSDDSGHTHKKSTVSEATQDCEKSANEIEQLKETLKQTILECKAKRKAKEERCKINKEVQDFYKQNLSESERSHIETAKSDNRILSQPRYSSREKQDHTNSSKEEVKHTYKDYKSFEKYQKQNKSLESYERSYTELMETDRDCRKLKSSNSSETSYLHDRKEQQKTSSNSRNECTSNNLPSQELTKSLKTKNSSRKVYKVESIESSSSTHSEVHSITRSKDSVRCIKSNNSNDEQQPLTSSISEALQHTYESMQQENESIPLNDCNKFKSNRSSASSHGHNDCLSFIKSHINCSRGDFQEIASKEAYLNETQFQQAIQKAASHISSTECAQSADDEKTSSVASKHKKRECQNSVNSNTKAKQKPLTTTSPSKLTRRISVGADIVKFFNQFHTEKCHQHETINESMSESSINYSSVGLYDKLIQNENNKSQHLMALLKMREKALLDRTKGQIAWLEVQKARYKAKGLINHIAAIKKKQRGILMKMEKEREEIKRLLQTTTNNNAAVIINTHSTATGSHKANTQDNTPPARHKRERLLPSGPLVAKLKLIRQPQQTAIIEHVSTVPILKATYELESSNALEALLKKREEDLRQRREHVERLIQWHRRLDEEEAEVLNLERQLLSYNNVPHIVVGHLKQQHTNLPSSRISTAELTSTQTASAQFQTIHDEEEKTATITPEKKRASRARKMEKRLKEIDKSLIELSHISASSGTTSGGVIGGQTHNENNDSVSSNNTEEIDFVRTTGMKLNKLWKRLTSQQREKFEPNRRYKLCKTDLERLYEEAKMAVLKDFTENEERIAQELLEKSASNISSNNSPTAAMKNGIETKSLEIPVLNLNFSSGHSEPEEEESTNNSNTNNNNQGNYSPSVAEQNFKAQELLNSSTSSESSEHQSTANRIPNKRLENNLQMFLNLSQRLLQTTANQIESEATEREEGLQRSLSDTDISNKPKFNTIQNITSQQNNATTASQLNSSIVATEQHQRSKSSIVEMTNIPSIQTQILNHTDIRPHTHTIQSQISNNTFEKNPNEIANDFEHINKHSVTTTIPPVRTSVICSIGMPSPIRSEQTLVEINTVSEDSKLKTISTGTKQKSSFSGQFDTNTKAREISNKLQEISATVTQLSLMNTALPSYDSVTKSKMKTKSSEDSVTTNKSDESNLSTDASSYSFDFENITTDKHSSPGNSTNPTNSLLPNKTITSITYTKQNDSSSLLSTTKETSKTLRNLLTNSKTFVKVDNDEKVDSSHQSLTQSEEENRILDTYAADFELDLSNATHIEDITIPIFETTAETTLDEEEHRDESANSITNEKIDDSSINTKESSNRSETLLNDEKLLTTHIQAFSKPDRELLPPPQPLPPPPPPPPNNATVPATSFTTLNIQTASNHLMPDIINELELRRHQLILDNDHLKQYEHVTAVPYMYVREIPNKPPPPYVPPAHGSPMTTIFPSEDRIKDITFRRTHELYCEFLKTDYCNEKGEKLPSVMEEQITNIYERIILDICREYLQEHEEILRYGDPSNFHSQLAFFNPPNRLRCIQDAIYKEVRFCLAMDKTQPKRTQIYSVYGQRAKQDHIGKIIIQEMYDEDDRWCNFHHEESEVLRLIVDEMINKNITTIAKKVLLEEGGTVDEEEKIQECITEEIGVNLPDNESILMETLNAEKENEDETYCVN